MHAALWACRQRTLSPSLVAACVSLQLGCIVLWRHIILLLYIVCISIISVSGYPCCYLYASFNMYLAAYAMNVADCIMQTKAKRPAGYYYVYGNNRGVAPVVLPTILFPITGKI